MYRQTAARSIRFTFGLAYLGVAWYFITSWLSAAGLLASVAPGRPPIVLGLSVLVPIVLFALAWRLLPGLRAYVATFDVSTLIGVQITRVIGGVFLFLYAMGDLPGGFAIPAGVGDVLVGLAAPLVASNPSRPLVILWSVFGLADLAAALTLGSLNGSRALVHLPLSIIPAFLVPLVIVLHIVVLLRLRELTRAASTAPRQSPRVQPANS